jgi:phosphonate transport system permease protein
MTDTDRLIRNLPKTELKHTVANVVGLGAFVALMVWAWFGAEIRPLDLIKGSGNSMEYARGFLRPDFSEWRTYLSDLMVTVHMALWGTLLAVIAAVPLGLVASNNIAPAWLRLPIRRFLDACRAVHELVFALFFMVAVGLGPFAGMLALFVHTSGVLGKLFSEVVEAIDPGPVEGIRATGARRLDEIAYGVVPQVLPLWISYSLYRFESNVRSAAVVGMVGAGGIGMTLNELIRSFSYAQTAAVMIMLVITVMVIDVVSAQVRKMTI